MKKIMFLVGAGVGVVLGSRAGREPYQKVETKIRQVSRRPEVRDAVDQVKGTAKDQVDSVTDKVVDKLPAPGNDSREPATPVATEFSELSVIP